MNILIIEDETQAAQRMKKLVSEIIPESNVLAVLDSVKRSVAWFQTNPVPDVVLMDIQLADGVSFEIFEQCEVKCPVIFTTAYDAYALKAFKVNSVDYILKPVDKDELKVALDKVKMIVHSESQTRKLLGDIGQAIQMLTRKYKTRFVIKVGEHLKTVEVSSIHFFYSQDKATFCVNSENRSLIIDFTMEELEEMLDPMQFFRINRKYFVSASAIQDIISYTNSRLRLVLKGSTDNDIIVARERVQDFKSWLDK